MDHPVCPVCLAPAPTLTLTCGHCFCPGCVRQYIKTLRLHNRLTPQKLCCLQPDCRTQIDDPTLMKLFPGEQGFVYGVVRRRYKQAKDPAVVVFCCRGVLGVDRKVVLARSEGEPVGQYMRRVVAMVQGAAKEPIPHTKTCNNIMSVNRSIARKQRHLQCNVCCVGYCLTCLDLLHEGPCQQNKLQQPMSKTQQQSSTQQMDNFMQRQGILRCLNPKCTVPIAKEQGCFWIKCRCSWQMCYPCRRLWGDCEHFGKYPYKKFTAPPQWMVKALNLY